MKKLILIVIILIGFGQSSCERDDICAESTPTTPLLKITFFDADNPSELKAPNNLSIMAEGQADMEEPFLTTSLDSISIPLRTGVDITETVFTLTINSLADDTEPLNIDVLTLAYIQEEEFVSKACGFRIIYTELTEQNSPEEDGAWIQDIELQTFTVEDETEAHIYIFH